MPTRQIVEGLSSGLTTVQVHQCTIG